MWYDGMCIMPYLPGNKPRRAKLARLENDLVARNFFRMKQKLALYRYKFEGLPDSISERVLKYSLLWHNNCIIFDHNGTLLALPGGGAGGVNVNGEFTNAIAYGKNGETFDIRLILPGEDDDPYMRKSMSHMSSKYEGVYIRENYDRTFPFIDIVFMISSELADSWRKVQVSRRNAATPYVVVTDEQGTATVRKAIEARDANEDIIVMSSGIYDPSKIQVTPITTASDGIKAHTDLIEWYDNYFNALCGLNSNAEPDKAERLIVSEVNANNQVVQTNIDDVIECISECLDNVNKHFGTNISVHKTGGMYGIPGVDNGAGPSPMGNDRPGDANGNP